ncbi:LLM class flavin-dependent oxidoreductase, partial [Candidatus Poribacteria bacterium]|nr:LLM class flavin-dependent oxidoreductase [Candidatus Poribacteria bacterium]
HSIWRVARNIFVGESNEEAMRHALSGTFARSFDYLIRLIGRVDGLKEHPDMPNEAVTPEYAVKKLAIVGDVDECIRRLREVWNVTGGFGTLLMIAHDWDDRAKWIRSMELLINEVVPALP